MARARNRAVNGVCDNKYKRDKAHDRQDIKEAAKQPCRHAVNEQILDV